MNPSVSNRIWHIPEEDREKTAELSSHLGISRIVAHLMTLRGITAVEHGKAFLNPCLEDLSDPFLLTDMRLAVERITSARRQKERVLVFGDYDVDGIAGTALLVKALGRFGIEDCRYALPSRLGEGYGLSPERVRTAHEEGVRLIVTVDNGINARQAAHTARELGIDLIVTDHHELEGDLPDALAVVDPAREDLSYPGGNVCGAAVAFKVAQALTGATEDLDIVALGTIADVMPLRRENRVLAALGLEQMAKHPRIGLSRLAAAAGVDIAEVTAEQIAFQLAPRINAAARLGDARLSLRLLLTDSDAEAARTARELQAANEKRRDIERAIREDAVEQAEAAVQAGRRSIVLGSRDWHPGVVGIVAARLQEVYDRPAVLVAIDGEGIGRGSARSPEGFDMVAAFNSCRDHLIRFGGHTAAAGMAVHEKDLDAFSAAFEAVAEERVAEEGQLQTLDIDAIVSLSEIDAQMLKALDRLQPFGEANPAPVFCTCGVKPLTDSVRILKDEHLGFQVAQGPRSFAVIGFGMADLLPLEALTKAVDLAFTPQFNTWRGETKIQLLLRDIRIP